MPVLGFVDIPEDLNKDWRNYISNLHKNSINVTVIVTGYCLQGQTKLGACDNLVKFRSKSNKLYNSQDCNIWTMSYNEADVSLSFSCGKPKLPCLNRKQASLNVKFSQNGNILSFVVF